MNLTPEQRRRMDRHYHDVIGGEYDKVILDPRQTASDLLFSSLVDRLPRSGRMLDIGCGTGQAICRFARRPANFESITAIDHSAGMLDAARRNVDRAGIARVKFVQTDVLEWLEQSEPETCDLITAVGFLHHLDDDQVRQVIAEMARRLAPGGKILIADPLDPEDKPEPRMIQRWNRRSLAVTSTYSEEPEEPDERPLPRTLMDDAFAGAGLKVIGHASSWEIFNHSTTPGLIERLKIRFLYYFGGAGIVNAWLLQSAG
jgi:ubiquinone/menaquinone biosynthesis C-methylase UbiE